MNTISNETMAKQNPNIKITNNIGSIYGFFAGAIAGTLLAGPNFQAWSLMQSVFTILGGGIFVAFIGHFAFASFLSSGTAGNVDGSTDEKSDASGICD